MKVCSKCKETKDLNEFGKDRRAKDGLRYQCKTCANEATRQRPRKKAEFTCKKCGKTKLVDYYHNRNRKTEFCVNCLSKATQTGQKRTHLSGENSARWGGGEYISSDGYRMIRCEGEFTASGRQVYKREHTLIMEDHLGRSLQTTRGGAGEAVHHIDGDKLNNNLDNLLLCKNGSEHKSVHHNLQNVAYELVQNGIIKFDKETNTYYWDNHAG